MVLAALASDQLQTNAFRATNPSGCFKGHVLLPVQRTALLQCGKVQMQESSAHQSTPTVKNHCVMQMCARSAIVEMVNVTKSAIHPNAHLIEAIVYNKRTFATHSFLAALANRLWVVGGARQLWNANQCKRRVQEPNQLWI